MKFNGNNVPILITILLAILAWTISHATTRFLQEPIVKISQQIISQDKTNSKIKFVFTNISNRIDFKGLELVIRGESKDDRFEEPEFFIVGGGWLPEVSLNHKKDGIDLKFKHFHPGWAVKITTTMSGSGNPQIQLKKAHVPTVLQQEGLKTLIIENEILIISSFGGIAFVLMLVTCLFNFRRDNIDLKSPRNPIK